MKNIPYNIQKITSVANDLTRTGKTGGSTSEMIAAAFVLNRMELIPYGYSMIEAWERLDDRWQNDVKLIRMYYQYLLVTE